MKFEPKHMPPVMTPKQVAILKALVKRNPDGSLLDIYQLIAAAAPGTTRGAMICSIRHLLAHGLMDEADLVVRDRKRRRTYQVTPAGVSLVRPSSLPNASSGKVRAP